MYDFLQPSRSITFGFKKLEVWGVIEASCYASFSHSFFWRRLILHRSCLETFLVEKSRVFARRFFWNLHTLSLLFKKLEPLRWKGKFFSSFSNYCLLPRHILHCFCFTTLLVKNTNLFACRLFCNSDTLYFSLKKERYEVQFRQVALQVSQILAFDPVYFRMTFVSQQLDQKNTRLYARRTFWKSRWGFWSICIFQKWVFQNLLKFWSKSVYDNLIFSKMVSPW